MNREELEKMFDEVFEEAYYRNHTHLKYDVKQFIFDTIIPEVLKNVIPEYKWSTQTKDDEINLMRYWHTDCINDMKQKAKELYNINL